jgi:hypothetical protein
LISNYYLSTYKKRAKTIKKRKLVVIEVAKKRVDGVEEIFYKDISQKMIEKIFFLIFFNDFSENFF